MQWVDGPWFDSWSRDNRQMLPKLAVALIYHKANLIIFVKKNKVEYKTPPTNY